MTRIPPTFNLNIEKLSQILKKVIDKEKNKTKGYFNIQNTNEKNPYFQFDPVLLKPYT
jgi:hypothetical protein